MTSPLEYAIWTNQIDAMRLLIDHGANVNKRDRYGGTPLHGAVTNKEAVILLINNGADVNAADNDGWTILKMASWLRLLNDDTTQLLKDNGAHM